MSEAAPRKPRSGGRQARIALRSAPLTEDIKPVRGGMSGGRYKPLSDADIHKIHNAALDVLATVGMEDATPSFVKMVCDAGGSQTPEGRLLFPKSLIDDTLAKAARNFVLHGQDPKHDMEPWGDRTYFGTAGAAVSIIDAKTGDYRDSTSHDLFDIARLVDQMDNVHFFQRSVVARDMVDPADMDFHTTYASIMGTTKHVGSSWVDYRHLEKSLEMLHMVAGGEDKWRERPFVSMSCCFVVPPLKFTEDACNCLEVAVRGGMPVLLLAAGQAGATSPASLAGAVVQEVAEVLAGLTVVNLIKPGAPAIFGTWPFVSDLRTGAMSGGSGEQALLMSACAQMANFYDLTGGVTAGMSDSKMPDMQAGYEVGYNHALVGNSGANMIYESVGMHASLLGFCMESVIIDNDSIGGVLRTVRGIEVNDETLSVDVIREAVTTGPGHFLGSDQTLKVMQSEYIYPTVGNRMSPKEWVEAGRPTIVDTAIKKKEELLASHYPTHISEEMDQAIRAKFDIKMSRESMLSGNDRW